MDKDLKHLRMLSIGFYVYAALMFLYSMIAVLYLSLGVAVSTGNFPGVNNRPPLEPSAGWIFVVFGSVFTFLGMAITLGNILTAWFIKRKKNYYLCFVIGALDCMFVPLGTILGVLTILVLLREPVKKLFNGVSQNELQPAMSMTPPDWR